MQQISLFTRGRVGKGVFLLLTLMIGVFLAVNAQAFTVNVVNQNGAAVTGFKWLLEKDNTHQPEPGVHKPVAADVNDNTLSISIHQSHAPTLAKGQSVGTSATINNIDPAIGEVCNSGPTCSPVPPGRYFVSVLPFGNYGACDGTFDMGGAPIDTNTQTEVTVYVRQTPIETAQISVKVFHDIAPLNNAPDAAEITPLPGGRVQTMENFTITLGDQGGDIIADAFGNKLGTTYQMDGAGNYVLDDACQPIMVTEGDGDFTTPPSGEVFIKNLAPGKYAVQVEPPAGQGWQQVTTIEGTKTIDAWVRPNEPPFLVEFGPPAWHTFFGFIKLPLDELGLAGPLGGPVTTITGSVNKGHLSRPPNLTFFEGPPPEGEAVGERCIVGLNTLVDGVPETVWAGKCEDETGNFTIPDVPPGTYQLVIWDISLLQIISFNTVITADTGGTLDVGNISVPMWFGQLEHHVYSDNDKDARRDADEIGVPEQNVNLRFRDGTIYQAFPTDIDGYVPFQGVFPFFHWLTAEVDFARLQATGLRVVVDDGGPVTTDQWGEDKRNPQIQANGRPFRIERGPVLTEAFQQFAGQNTRFEWGKATYDGDVNAVVNSNRSDYFLSTYNWPTLGGDVDTCTDGAPGCTGGTDGRFDANGGISGTVTYAVTRAEDDPRFTAVEPWEPGVPRVQVNLYRDVWCSVPGLPGPADVTPAIFPLCPTATPGEGVGDGVPDDKTLANGNTVTPGVFTPPDVDNYPLNWAPANCTSGGQTCLPGPEDVDHNNNGNFNLNDAIRVTWTDSWDDNQPEGCVGDELIELQIHGTPVPMEQCAEGLRTFNQVRPGVFDGGFAFGPRDSLLVPGTYIVEAITPPGYELVKEEDRNVDFGPTAIPAIPPPVCVGDDHLVPPYFSFLTDDMGNLLPGLTDTGLPDENGNGISDDVEAPFAGETRKLCDRKKVDLGAGQNAAVEFHLFTDVPKAARGVGIINSDLANALGPGTPNFSEKYSPPWLPIAVFDYTGQEIFRTYGDEFGGYNFMAASTYAINLPTPSGVGPKMLNFCLNHPGPIEDPANPGEFIDDPRFRTNYGTACYTFNFETGRITYLDTPVIRKSAFVGGLQSTLDCEQPQGIPVIESVINTTTGEPAILRAIPGTANRLRIRSMGNETVPNPAFPGGPLTGDPTDPPVVDEFITRNHGFGPDPGVGNRGGKVCVDANPNDANPPVCFADNHIVSWGNRNIVVRINNGNPLPFGMETGQLTVARSNGNTTEMGLTLTVTDAANNGVGGNVSTVACGAPAGQICTGSIQDAIDAAADGDLILVEPGIYTELPILYKRVKLQGAGAGSTTIRATQYTSGPAFTNPLVTWQNKVTELEAAGSITPVGTNADGPGIFVSPVQGVFGFTGNRDDLSQRARIDGFKIILADQGGGIYANQYANRLQISNNRITSNAGNDGGGVRVGNPLVDSPNPGIDIRYNHIDQNGSFNIGGGIALYKGANNYRITDNFICGNFGQGGGGGIAHRGLMDGNNPALIAGNDIVFNEAFQGGNPLLGGIGIGGGGGGIEIAGDNPNVVPTASGLSEGSGDVTIDKNLLQGNLGGAADGGAIALRAVNGEDVATDVDTPNTWHQIDILNNIMVNNVTGLAGAGLAMQDATRVRIIHNTIANNDSVATSTFAFENGIGNPTTPQVAGIVSRAHSAGLLTVLAGAANPQPEYSEPRALRRNIIHTNRSFFWNSVDGHVPNTVDANWDLGVIGVTGGACLSPTQSVLTDLAPAMHPTDPLAGCSYSGSNNFAIDPVRFRDEYFNQLVTAAAADEGGNFVQIYYTPLGVTGNYHLGPISLAIDLPPNGSNTGGLLSTDIDGEPRPAGVGPDAGADEYQP